jgi:HTH-type transcriptional regulator/antitoxin HigA
MEVEIIKTPEQYEQTVKRMMRLGDPAPGTPEADELEILALLCEKYDKENEEPIPDASPEEVIQYLMDHKLVSQADIGRIIGSRQRVNDVLHGRRVFTTNHAFRLSHHFDIPVSMFLNKPKLA